MTALTPEDFADVPWGGMASTECGRRAVRVPEMPGDPQPWSEKGKVRWHTDEEMAADGGWRIILPVTTAREALDAAWELAHEPEDGIIPAGAAYLVRSPRGGTPVSSDAGVDLKAINGIGERRLLDPPKPKPEPWEIAPYVICDEAGETIVLRRTEMAETPMWFQAVHPTPYLRTEVAAMSPRPFDPKEV